MPARSKLLLTLKRLHHGPNSTCFAPASTGGEPRRRSDVDARSNPLACGICACRAARAWCPAGANSGAHPICAGAPALSSFEFRSTHAIHCLQPTPSHPGAMQCCSLLAPAAVPLARRHAAFSNARTQLMQPLRSAQASLTSDKAAERRSSHTPPLKPARPIPFVLIAASGTDCCTSGGGQQQQRCTGSGSSRGGRRSGG